ncbi:MAG TPA: efflux RND transporter periplasmic adaptor subunit [Longimicrobiales bacterium]
MTWRHRQVFGVLAVGAVLAACAGGGSQAAEANTEAAAITLNPADLAVAQRDSLAAAIVVTGTLLPYREVEVRAQVPGVLTGLRVDRGDAVREGQVLARIEAEGIRGQAASAQAGVAAAEANLALAARQLESARKLHEAGAMSEIEFRQAQAAYEAAQAQLEAARAQAVGAGEQARRTTVVAPFAGEVSKRHASEGEAVNIGQALFTIVDARILELAGQVPVNRAAGLRPGLPVEFTVDALPGRVLRGEVARVEPTADPATGQVGVYVRLPNHDRALVGGLFATGRILTGERQDGVVVPTSAVRRDASQPYVWAIRDGRAVRQPVTVGAEDVRRGVVQVLAGLEAGEQVIAAPGTIEDGALVRIAGAPPAAVSPVPQER